MPPSPSCGSSDRGRGAPAPLLLALVAALAGPARAEVQSMLLAVELNGRSLDQLLEVTQRDGRLEAAAEDLRVVGLRVAADPAAPVALDTLPGLRLRLDRLRQVLVVEAEAAALEPRQLAASEPGALPVAAADTGAVLNYGLFGAAGRGSGGSGLFEGRLYSPYGVLESSALVARGFGPRGGRTEEVQASRLDTVFSLAEPESTRRWRGGDVISGGLPWTRPYRLGGVQLASDFSIRPDLVTFPVPVLGGHVGVPSTVDLLINGVRQFSQPVEPGAFEVRRPPVVSGAGELSMVVRDATGRESVRNLSFYASNALLRPGLAAYSLEAGWVRAGYGLAGTAYREPAGSGTLRYGLLDWLTGELHAEGGGPVGMAGLGSVASIAGRGLLSAAAAASQSRDGGTGVQYAVGLERAGRAFSLSARLVAASRGFRDVPAAAGGNPVPRMTLRLGAGLPLGDWGALNAAFVAVKGGWVPVPGAPLRFAAGDAQVLSASYTRPVTGSVALYATGFRDFAARGATGFGIGLSIAFGDRRSASLSGGFEGGRPVIAASASQAAFQPGELGLRATVSEGAVRREALEASTVLPWGTAMLGAEQLGPGGGAQARAGLQGALVVARPGVFPSNRIGDSFAILDAGGLAGVRVLQENRPVGRTDASGHLLLPNLRGWDANLLALDPADLPADVEMARPSRLVRPPERAGVTIRMPLRRSRSAVVRLVDEAGRAIPPGAVAMLARTGRRVPVGHDGESFLTDLTGDDLLEVEMPNRRCTARLRFTPVPGDIPRVGPLPCREARP